MSLRCISRYFKELFRFTDTIRSLRPVASIQLVWCILLCGFFNLAKVKVPSHCLDSEFKRNIYSYIFIYISIYVYVSIYRYIYMCVWKHASISVKRHLRRGMKCRSCLNWSCPHESRKSILDEEREQQGSDWQINCVLCIKHCFQCTLLKNVINTINSKYSYPCDKYVKSQK